jgi:hypothetical protein
LFHQIPPNPAYLRVKIGRRLSRIGAVALKNTVYALPRTEAAIEDLQWIRGEIVAGGGDATIVEAQLLEGLDDGDVESLFRAARDHDYEALAADARAVLGSLRKVRLDEADGRAVEAEVARIENRLEEIAAIDFFSASGREAVGALLETLRARTRPERRTVAQAAENESPRGRTWVTRAGVHVDRIASAWLIRRFIDSEARFKFVSAKGYVPEPGELRFDMFEAEYSHEGDNCTFETLCRRFRVEAPGLAALAEIVHDIDVKDAKFGRAETAGVAAQIAGLALRHRDDEARLAQGGELFEQLLVYFSRKRDATRRAP